MTPKFKRLRKKPAYNRIDRTGQVYNYWTIVRYVDTPGHKARYLCRCKCGKEKVAIVTLIVNGTLKSCGCRNAENHVIHGKSRTRIYRIWKGMRTRCLDPKSTAWRYYGGRGIQVCDEWSNSFDAFLRDMGEPPPKLSIDRINNDGNYEKSNCRWATAKEQANNKRQRRKKALPEPPKI